VSETPYDLLLERILLGEYPPGTALVEPEIAKEFGVSRTPVREALLRLKVEGLVKIIPRGGIYVAEAPLRLIREVTQVRMVLEEYLAHLLVERRTDDWLEESQRWLEKLEARWPSLSPREWMKKDAEFHELLDKASSNEVLSNQLALLRRKAVLFWGQSTDGQASLRGIIGDFRDTLKAVRERNFEACARVLRRHVLDHVERIQNYMKPEVFRLSEVLQPQASAVPLVKHARPR
jgi:DNA-binding GntR family transcriptional regulator